MTLFKRIIVSAFRIIIGILALTGTSQAWLWHVPQNLVYFTVQSNIAVGIVFIWAGVSTLLQGYQPPAWLKGAVTLYIGITGLVANIILERPDISKGMFFYGIPQDYIVHSIVPLCVFIDFIFADPHRRFKWHYPLSWMIYIYCWLIFVVIRALIWPTAGVAAGSTNPWPYPFVNIPELGVQKTIINLLVYSAVFLVLGYILYGIDRLMPAKPLLTTSRSRKPPLPKEENM